MITLRTLLTRQQTMSSSPVSPSIFSPLSCGWLLFFCALCTAVHSSELPWIRLTHDNFSSDIHTHPYLLCLATVPWCGESKSLMRELSKFISVDESLHSLIHLRIVYINLDKSLERFFYRRVRYPTFTFFWHSTPLKYKGKLRLQNILTAINRAIGLSSWDFPLKKLETSPDLESFMDSTDRAVILFDLCNYTDKIRKSKHHQVVDKPVIVSAGSRGNSNIGMIQDRSVKISYTNTAHETPEDLQDQVSSTEEYQSVFPVQQNVVQEYAEVSSRLFRNSDALHGMVVEDITKDRNESPSNDISCNLVGENNDVQQEVVSCDDESEVLSMNSPRFLFAKKSSEEDRHEKSWFTDSTKTGVLTQVEGCNRTEYSRFANVYQRLIKIVRAYTLTPQLANFAVIKNKRLLSTWGIEKMQNHTWFLMQRMPDWPNVPRLYYESETLESFLFGSKQLVRELNRESINHPTTFRNSTLPVILFIDKVSPHLEVRTKSWEALTALRAFAREHVRQENLEMHPMEFKPVSEGLASLVKSVVEKDMPKESVISLKSLFGQNDALLPTDQPIRVSKITPSEDLGVLSQATGFGQNVVLKVLVEGNEKVQLDANVLKGGLQGLDFSKLLLSEDNAINTIQEGKIAGKADADSVSSSLEGLGRLFSSNIGGSFIDLKAADFSESAKKGRPTVELREEHLINEANHGSLFSFYYADGEDQWKDTVQPALPYPSLVILDSLKGGKFVFPTHNQSIDHISLKAFFDQCAAKKLQKTYVSEVVPRKPREQVQPPFVNRDFHEVDGVPCVTAERLLQLLAQRLSVGHLSVSFSDCTEDMHQFWKRAALVLFTTQSCGFCKRMEFVFREVHRLLTRNWDRSTKGGFSLQSMNHPYSTFDKDDQNVDLLGENLFGTKELESKKKLPRLLQIDCTLNDCSAFFESIDQEELYPSLILYPAENKTRTVVFEGRSTVREILKFIAVEREADTRILSFLRGSTQKKRSDTTAYSQMHLPHSSQSIIIDSSSTSGSRHAYHFTADTTELPSSSSEVGDDKDLKLIIYPTVGSVLMATDQLSEASKTFESTKILVVKADGQEGFQGLILNKPLAWNRLPGLDKEMEPLVNKTVLCYGGPVILQGEPFLSLSRSKDMEGFAEVIPSVYVGGSSATMRVFQSIKEGRLDAANFWFFLGHTVWGWQQLLNEIEQQWWNLTSYYEGPVQLPVQEWLKGSTISVEDLLRRRI